MPPVISGAVHVAQPGPVSAANVPPLPSMGSVSSQIAQGQSILSKFSNLGNQQNVTDLLGAGVTLAQGLSGTGGAMVRTMVTVGAATASGAAVGGPFGAAAGAIIGAVSSLFSGGPPAPFQGLFIGTTPGSFELYKGVYQWQQMHTGATSGAPLGQTFAEYLVFKYPPHMTRRPLLMWSLVWHGSMTELAGNAQEPGTDPSQFAFPVTGGTGFVAWPLGGAQQSDAHAYLESVAPVDTSILWSWAQPSGQISSASAVDTVFPAESTAVNDTLWRLDTTVIPGTSKHPGMSVDEIMKSAERRRPDPMYFARELYVNQVGPMGPSGAATWIRNTAPASALATVCGMLGAGASTRAIAAELEQQQTKILLLDEGIVSGLAGYKPTDVIPPLFRQLLEDYVALAHAEAKNPNVSMDQVIASMGDRPANDVFPGVMLAPPALPVKVTASQKASTKIAAAQVISKFISRYVHR